MSSSMKKIIAEKLTVLNEFAASLGYQLTQINGQRILGPPLYWSGPKPIRGSEIFVCNLPREWFEFDFFDMFANIGPIYKVRLMMDFSGFNRGFCFITYINPHLARLAVRNLKLVEIKKDRFLHVYISIDNDRLFIANIPQGVSEKDVNTVLRSNFTNVTKILLPKSSDGNLGRGFAFVQFSSHLCAMAARKQAHPDKIVLWGRRLHVDWAIPKCYAHKLKNQVYIGNISKYTTRKRLTAEIIYLTKENKIVSLRKEANYAIVTFSCYYSAQRAINALKGLILNNHPLFVDWKIEKC